MGMTLEEFPFALIQSLIKHFLWFFPPEYLHCMACCLFFNQINTRFFMAPSASRVAAGPLRLLLPHEAECRSGVAPPPLPFTALTQ